MISMQWHLTTHVQMEVETDLVIQAVFNRPSRTLRKYVITSFNQV